LINKIGELAEWLKAHAWKACKGLSLSRVRISRSPPHFYFKLIGNKFFAL
jgi:hypothetical protein